jgi:membrane fusion protein
MSIVEENKRMHAELYIPSRAVGFTRVGQEVRLMYDAFPYQKFGTFSGKIRTISRTVIAPNELDNALKDSTKEAVYQIDAYIDQQTVEAFNQSIKLQPGMSMKASIVLDKRSFLDWILEPVNTIKKRAL